MGFRRDADEAARLLPFFRPYAGRFAAVVALTVVGALAEGGQAYLLQPLLNGVLLGADVVELEEEDQELAAALAEAAGAPPPPVVAPPPPDAPAPGAGALRAEAEALPWLAGRAAPGAWRADPVCALVGRTRSALLATAWEGDALPEGARRTLARALALQREAGALLLPDPPAAAPAARAAAAARSLEARGLARDAHFAGTFTLLGRILAAALGLAVALGLTRYLTSVWSREVVARVYQDLQVATAEHLLRLSPGQVAQARRGDVLSRVTTDLSRLVNGVLLPLCSVLLLQPIRIALLYAVAVFVSWRLALCLLALAAVTLWPIRWWGKFIRRSARERQSALGDVLEAIHQLLAGIRLVKAFRREDHERVRFRETTARALAAEVAVVRARTASRTWIHLVNDVTFPLVFLGGGYLVVSHVWGLDAGRFATFAGLIVLMYRPAKSMVTAYNTLQDSLPSMRRAFEVLDTAPAITDAPGARPVGRPAEALRLEGVGFSYDGEARVLDGIDLEARVGTTTAIVGRTGAGKSTLMDLLARFLDPTAGRVTVDGAPLDALRLADWRARLALVSQQPFLFHDTVRENIRYGRLDATDAEVEEAARKARVHDEVLALPGGYDYVVGERGSRLSGGQVQRLTIARAILRDPDVLLLDEATSALDAATERQVQAALADLERGRTTFVIAHRLSTVRHADQILVLEGGRVVERGAHADLLARGGRYADLVRGMLEGAAPGGAGAGAEAGDEAAPGPVGGPG